MPEGGRKNANMALSEHETRGQLIDRQLVQAGWRLDDRTQVRREVPADHAVRETSETAYGSAVSGGISMQLMAQKKAVVVPILLSCCSWREEDFAKLEKLPKKDAPVSSFRPRENAWVLVEEGIKKAVESMRSTAKV